MNAEALRPITFGKPGEEIGRRELGQVIGRFQNLHKLQLQRIQETLGLRQRDFLQLLPLLFHTNHPALPGFVGSDTPAGLPNFTPLRTALSTARRYSKSFEYKRRALPDYPIHGIFLMGSVGSIAYSRKSDLDIWLCHDPGLDEYEVEDLEHKAAAIEAWATSLRLEVHIFFINPVQFRAGVGQPISTESCGSIQHHLLLEEFYRTSLHIAGRVPAWWLVPPEQDPEYTDYLDHLCSKRFINPRDIIDFGGLEQVSAEEFLGGTLWHLYKAIGSPHKSLLKLLLMESYSAEFPNPEWLCTRLKRALYAGSVDINELDSYLLMYRKVEAYLKARREYERLDLARQSFYLKLNELLSVPEQSSVEKRTRREVLEEMVGQWGWSPARVRELDGRRRARIARILEDQQEMSRELTRNYQGVSRFARDYAQTMHLQSDEIVLLGRRLYAALEHKPGKVELLSADGYEEIEPEELSLVEVDFADGVRGFALYAGRRQDEAPLRQAHSLLEILAWLTLNTLYRREANIAVKGGEIRGGLVDLRRCIDTLSDFLRRNRLEEDTLEPFSRPARIEASALFINLTGVDRNERKDGLSVASSRFDPLSFGAARSNLIHCVDRIDLSSWHEVLVSHHVGLIGLFDCLTELVNKSITGGRDVPLEFFSFGSSRARSIAMRVENLYQQIRDTFREPSADRFVVRGGEEFFLFERAGNLVRFDIAPGEDRLLEALGQIRPTSGILHFDASATESCLPAFLYAKQELAVVQFFVRQQDRDVVLHVVDERGSLFSRIHHNITIPQLLAHYTLFLSCIQQHFVLDVRGVQYFQVDPDGRGGLQSPVELAKPMSFGSRYALRVMASENAPGRVSYIIDCNGTVFTSMATGESLFAQVAAHVMTMRNPGERYPVYVTDIDVPLSILGVDTPEQLQTLHLLRYKQRIEARLNPR